MLNPGQGRVQRIWKVDTGGFEGGGQPFGRRRGQDHLFLAPFLEPNNVVSGDVYWRLELYHELGFAILWCSLMQLRWLKRPSLWSKSKSSVVTSSVSLGFSYISNVFELTFCSGCIGRKWKCWRRRNWSWRRLDPADRVKSLRSEARGIALKRIHPVMMIVMGISWLIGEHNTCEYFCLKFSGSIACADMSMSACKHLITFAGVWCCFFHSEPFSRFWLNWLLIERDGEWGEVRVSPGPRS